MPQAHIIPPGPSSQVWGYFDATLPPVLEVDSGDTVTLTSFPPGGEVSFPPDRSLVTKEHRETLGIPPGPGPHFVTGPIHVRGAEPGDVLQIDILAIEVSIDWGFVALIPLLGTLPEDFPERDIIHPLYDRARNVWRLPWGLDLPADPFFGIMAVHPPKAWGRQPSPPPRVFGGNMDNKELRAGSTLYLPVFEPGAGFYAGDGHGAQGDGEVCITAIETGLTGTFRLTVRKDLGYRHPFAETPTHLVSIGLDEDLDDAAKQAVREMIGHITRRTNLSRNHAYMLCSIAGDLRVTQTVDGVKGCHMMLAKSLLKA